MRSLIASVALLTGVSYAEPSCKAVEYSLSALSTYSTTTFAIDVCYSTTIDASGTTEDGNTYETSLAYSYWWYCTSDGDVWIASYNSEDCSGYPFSQTAASAQYFNVVGYCEKPACEYVTLETSTSVTTDCSDPDAASFASYSQSPLISGYCNSVNTLTGIGAYSYTYECSNGEAVYNLYNGVTDCSGDAITQTFDLSVDYSCKDDSETSGGSAAISLKCGSATFAGLLNTENSDNSNPVYSEATRIYGIYVLAMAVLAAFSMA